MDDQKLSRTLESLPRERAGAGFTADVMRRLEEPRPAPASRRPVRWSMMAAAAVLLLAIGLGAREWWHLHQRQQVTARIEALEAERLALAMELEEMRRLVHGAQPRVYLGGSNDIDLMLDLGRLRRSGVRPEEVPRGLLEVYRGPIARGAIRRGPSASRGTCIQPARLEGSVRPTIY